MAKRLRAAENLASQKLNVRRTCFFCTFFGLLVLCRAENQKWDLNKNSAMLSVVGSEKGGWQPHPL